jgi:hypothetical protein
MLYVTKSYRASSIIICSVLSLKHSKNKSILKQGDTLTHTEPSTYFCYINIYEVQKA